VKVCSDLDSLFRNIVSEESINSVLLLFLYNLDAVAREGYVPFPTSVSGTADNRM